jgi:hypothetical protein
LIVDCHRRLNGRAGPHRRGLHFLECFMITLKDRDVTLPKSIEIRIVRDGALTLTFSPLPVGLRRLSIGPSSDR